LEQENADLKLQLSASFTENNEFIGRLKEENERLVVTIRANSQSSEKTKLLERQIESLKAELKTLPILLAERDKSLRERDGALRERDGAFSDIDRLKQVLERLEIEKKDFIVDDQVRDLRDLQVVNKTYIVKMTEKDNEIERLHDTIARMEVSIGGKIKAEFQIEINRMKDEKATMQLKSFETERRAVEAEKKLVILERRLREFEGQGDIDKALKDAQFKIRVLIEEKRCLENEIALLTQTKMVQPNTKDFERQLARNEQKIAQLESQVKLNDKERENWKVIHTMDQNTPTPEQEAVMKATISKQKGNLEALVIKLRQDLQICEKTIRDYQDELARKNKVNDERAAEIERYKLEFAKYTKNTEIVDKTGELEALKQGKIVMQELRIAHEKEKNQYKIKIQELLSLLTAKDLELKETNQMGYDKRGDLVAIQKQFERFRDIEKELSLRNTQYEQAVKEIKEARDSRFFLEKENRRITELNNKLGEAVRPQAEITIETETIEKVERVGKMAPRKTKN